jgi:AcrR family transcriptional regulator
VLLIAVDVFNRHGYDATSMGILAENLGISKSAIYHHVPSKGDLLKLALDHALGGLEAILSEPEAQTGSAEARLEFVVRQTISVLVDRLPFVTLLLRLRGNTEIERDAMERRRAFDHKVAALISAARDEGSLRKDIDPRTVTRLLFGTINSIVEWYKPGGSLSPEKLADDVITMAFHGLRAQPSCTVRYRPKASGPGLRLGGGNAMEGRINFRPGRIRSDLRAGMAFGHFGQIRWDRPARFRALLQCMQPALQNLHDRQPVPVMPFVVQKRPNAVFIQGVNARRQRAKGNMVEVG